MVLPFSKKLPKYHNIVVFKYYCIIEFVEVYQVNKSLRRTKACLKN